MILPGGIAMAFTGQELQELLTPRGNCHRCGEPARAVAANQQPDGSFSFDDICLVCFDRALSLHNCLIKHVA